MNLSFIIAIKQVSEREFGVGLRDLGFEEVEVVVGVAIDDGDADVVVGVVRVGGLVDFRGTGGDDVGGVEARVHGVGLTGVDHEEHFVVPEPNPKNQLRVSHEALPPPRLETKQ